MTVVNYLTKTDLPNAFNTGNFDPASQQAVINQLIADGLYDSGPDDGKSIWVESDIYQGVSQPPIFGAGTPPGTETQVGGPIQLLEITGNDVTVNTDSTLKVIVDDGSNSSNVLNITGGANNEFIALGNSTSYVTLLDQGNDTVLAGSGGNDVIVSNNANDSLLGGGGADTLYATNGADTLIAGTGANSELLGGTGPDVLTDLSSGGHDSLFAGSGNDTITGEQGDYFGLPSSMAASGNDVYNIHDGGGNSTISLGTGADTVNFFTTNATMGNDTISNGGSGTDTVSFSGSGSNTNNFNADVKSITEGTGAQTGDYTLTFNDGQTVQLDGHGVSSTQNAFEVQFQDTHINLKGGS